MATWDELTPAEKQRYIDAMYASDVMPPPRADAAFTPTVPTTGSSYQFGDVGRGAGNEALQAAYTQLAGAVNPQSRNLLDVATNYATGTTGGLLSGAIGLGQKAGGYAADVLGAGAEALPSWLGGDRWSRGGSAQALYGDMQAGGQTAGLGTEANALGLLSELGAGKYARGAIADRLNQAGPVPTMYSNPLMGGGMSDPTKTGWTFRDVDKSLNSMLSRSENRILSGDTSRIESVPIRQLHATQPSVNPDFATTSSSIGELPLVVRKNGKMFIQDGHHRLTALAENGQQNAKVRFIDLDNADTSMPLLDWSPEKTGFVPSDQEILDSLFSSISR